MNLHFITPNDPRWGEVLEKLPHDYYHLPQYTAASAEQGGGSAEAVLVTEGDNCFFLPYIVSPIPESITGRAGEALFDIQSPYGYPGPLCRGSETFLKKAVQTWCEGLGNRGVVSAFIRCHPILNEDSTAMSAAGELISRGPTVSIDLSLSETELWSQLRRNHQRDVKKCKKLGFISQIVPAKEALDSFVDLYYQSMDRLAADSSYYFSRELFHRLAEALSDKLWLCNVFAPDNTLISSFLFSECRQLVQSQLFGLNREWKGHRPDKLQYYEVSCWAAARGNKWMPIGGGLGSKEDALLRVKSGFSPIMHEFSTWHLTFLPDVYRRLTDRVGSTQAGFFPAYRSKVSDNTDSGEVDTAEPVASSAS